MTVLKLCNFDWGLYGSFWALLNDENFVLSSYPHKHNIK